MTAATDTDTDTDTESDAGRQHEPTGERPGTLGCQSREHSQRIGLQMTEPAGFAVQLRLQPSDPSHPPVPMVFDDIEPRPFGRTLRLALAMRGGVSLASWIGGTVAELDILRRLRLVRRANGLAAYMLVADPGSATPVSYTHLTLPTIYSV